MIKKTWIWQRLTDKKYTLLPKKELAMIEPLSSREARRYWQAHVSKRKSHLMLITGKEPGLTVLEKFFIDTGRKTWSRNILRKKVTSKNQMVVLLWGPDCGVRTNWYLFLKRWNDFWYPGENNNVILLPEAKKRLDFVDEGNEICILWGMPKG